MSTLNRRGMMVGLAGLAVMPGGPAVGAGGVLRLTATGQALLQAEISARPYEGFADLAARLAQADAVFTQLESALDAPGAGPPTRAAELEHAAPPDVLRTLRALSVNLVATAGNHAFDLGTGGVLATLAALDAAGLAHAGTGADRAAAAAPAFVDTPAGRVALVAMAAGKIREGGAATADRAGVNEIRRRPDGTFDPADESLTLAAITRAAAGADLVVAYHHNHYWADDPAATPDWLAAWARRCVDAGAHVFVGHGHPALQGIEVYRGRPLLYDLGGLFFQTRTPLGRYPAEAWQSVLAEMAFRDGALQGLELVPVVLNERAEGTGGETDPATRGLPRLARGAEAAAILDRLAARSAPFGTRFTRQGDRATLIV
ncbi:CapA family protein [Nitrospirillum iridis]|uniref:Poly-gamma-glutamate synthesis protein (Capsule biosynthesis protein) n=1 Tax=Nitrospirillum iridis TaxID=765888 RepID=A0A7X0EBI6_9PROT|nr:CapA family protein [Nitrospirillum iridis]MBB6250155.1 poly-gamma-glutamate synthesis protein (capsule biosynthesis protein) [Nitrospirillum iridis]